MTQIKHVKSQGDGKQENCKSCESCGAHDTYEPINRYHSTVYNKEFVLCNGCAKSWGLL